MPSSAFPVPAVSAFSVPGPPLSDFVACFWYVVGLPPASPRERVLPDGAVQIIFKLRDGGFRTIDSGNTAIEHQLSGAIVTAPSTRCTIIDTRDTAATVGVSFRPGGAAPLVGLPVSTLGGFDIELDAAWGRQRTDRLHARLAEALSAADAFRILEAALIERLERRLMPHPAVHHALGSFARSAHTAGIAQVREATGLSHRRFVEVFTRAVGLAPKAFCRLQRFQRVLRLGHRREHVRWSEVASACGYSDQSHLIHDFRAFSGLTPSDWDSRRTAFVNHVRL